MTIYYDPKNKKVKPWVMVLVIVLPIILIVLFFIWGSSKVEKKQPEVEVIENIFE